MYKVKADIKIVGINPFINIPDPILTELFKINGKASGPIPVKGAIEGIPYQQTLLRYKGQWILYINTRMLKNSPKRVGETIELSIAYDSSDRSVEAPPQFMAALNKSPRAKKKFQTLIPSLQKEIFKYISFLKTEESIDRNVKRAVDFLLGKASFVGRKPLQ